MRILHVTDAYLPKQGGIEVQVRGLAARQLDDGHAVEVLTCASDQSLPAPRADRGPGDLPEPPVHRVRSPWTRVRRTDAALRRRLRGLGSPAPDAVHVHLSVLSPLGILAVRAAAAENVPVVATVHSLWWLASPLYRAADLLIRWGSWPVRWTAVSELAAEPLRSVLGDRADVAIMPNGVEPGEWAVEPLDRDPTDVLVVSVMRLAARKRPLALLRVVADAARRLPPGVRLRVILVGEGPKRSRLERTITRLGLDDVIQLAGRLEPAEIRELYRRADLYLAPAVLESFGIAALEARCAGVPVVARRHTGIAGFVTDGVHGLLADDDAELAAALVRLATDPTLKASIAEHNRSTTPETGWADVLQRAELAYKDAAGLVD